MVWSGFLWKPCSERGELDYPRHQYNPSPQRSQCNQWTKTQNQSRMLGFSFSPHICTLQNLKKTPPKSLLNNLAWIVYPLTKRHKITRKYKVLKPFPEATIAYTVYLFQFLCARQDLMLSVQGTGEYKRHSAFLPHGNGNLNRRERGPVHCAGSYFILQWK